MSVLESPSYLVRRWAEVRNLERLAPVAVRGDCLHVLNLLLGLLFVAVAASILGFATVGMHPAWAEQSPALTFVRTHAFSLGVQALLGLSFVSFFLFIHRHWRWRWLLSFALVFWISLVSEYCGTSFGVPFGRYEYTNLLGYRIAERVPVVVLVSWFTMGVASYALSARLLPERMFWLRHLVTAAFLTCWDLVLDPASSRLLNYWNWGEHGVYYGTPLMNFGGWFLTGVVISLVLEATLPRTTNAFQVRWLAAYYLIHFLLPLGIMMAGGLWIGCFAAVACLVALVLSSRMIGYTAQLSLAN